jgi:hypothetical protein
MDDYTKIDIAFNPMEQRMIGVAREGMIPFDVPYITEITDGLWQGGCANGLVLPTHINYLLSLYPWERYTINHEMRGEMYHKMYDDSSIGIDPMVDDLARLVNTWRKQGKGQVLVHCQAGLNRSSLILVRALILDGTRPKDAIALVREKRSPACLCNKTFENWLLTQEETPSYDE